VERGILYYLWGSTQFSDGSLYVVSVTTDEPGGFFKSARAYLEVLKFIGDVVLAMFWVEAESSSEACEAAVRVAYTARERVG
jgi:hypothetical protein